MITKNFYQKIRLVVDQPKQGRAISNVGNIARQFFDNPKTIAKVTRLNSNLIDSNL